VFVVAALFAGIYPKPMIDRVEPSVAALVERVRAAAQDGEVAP
jgi:NADH:ubiquinone oxidoreductase subunit 4 (subunit M)